MCGIAGYISNSGKLSEETLQHFIRCQHHRGPDSSGIYTSNGIGLAHNRLSILDTSAKGNQPFFSRNGRYVMVYNGEVYNYNELKNKLNFEPVSNSDTEVILELFSVYGEQFVHQLRGMFSIVIYDKEENNLRIFRDRFGIKPLYYYSSQDHFIFSSEISGLAELGEIRDHLSLDQESIEHFLHLGFIPGESTVFKEIKQFPAGCFGKTENDLKLNISKYWKAEDYITTEKTKEDIALKNIKNLLYESVYEHLVSDVPVGLFLSGGTDSSLLAAIATEIQPGRLKTFTIGMEGIHNEAPAARRISEFLKTDHFESYLTDEKTRELLGHINSTYGEPFGDTSAIPTILVSELASRHVKVVLSGEGADELFLGYNSFNWAKRLNNPILRIIKKPVTGLTKTSESRRLQKLGRLMSKQGTNYQASNIYSIEHGFFTAQEISKIRASDYKGFSFKKTQNYLMDQILFELEVSLKGGLLVKIDRATMQYGLEARVPYLDHRLVEYVLSLDNAHKLKPNKYLLKKILYELIPEELFNNKKWGFGISNNILLNKILSDRVKIKEANSLQKLFACYNLVTNRFNYEAF